MLRETTLAAYGFLAAAILAEIIGTASLKLSEQFTRPGPSAVVCAAYVLAFYFLSLSLKELNLGVAYAIWCGVGIVCIALIQVLWFQESLDLPAFLGIGLIIAGVVVINVFSKTVRH